MDFPALAARVECETESEPEDTLLTVTLQEAVTVPVESVAVMVAVPAFRPLILPLFTPATEVLFDRHVTAVEDELVTFAVMTAKEPSLTVTLELDSVTVAAVFTVTAHWRDTSPVESYTVMVAVPGATPVTLPLLSTFATAVLEDLNFTFPVVTGVVVAVSVNDCDAVMVLEAGLIVRDIKSVFTDFTVHFAVFPVFESTAVMTALPDETPCIQPPDVTETTEGFEDSHLTSPVLFFGISFIFSPTLTVIVLSGSAMFGAFFTSSVTNISLDIAA